MSDEQQMSFWDHLDALRSVLIRIVIVVAVAAVAAFTAMPWIFDNVIMAPCTDAFPTYRLFDHLARADLFGYQRWTPDPGQVESAYLGNLGSAPYDSGRSGVEITDPELIREIVALHGELVRNLGVLERTRWTGAEYRTSPEGEWETSTATVLRLEYRMKDSTFENRWYTSIPISEELLADPDSYAARLQALLNRPELLRESYLDGIDFSGEGADITLVGGQLINIRGEESERELSREESERLWAAFQEDLEAGRIHRYLMDDREREENCYYTDVNFALYQSWVDREGKRQSGSGGLAVTVQKSASSMMKALEEMGVKELLAQRGSGEPSTREVVTDRYHIYEGEGPRSEVVEFAG